MCDTMCSICLLEISDDYNNSKKLDCGHKFHIDCIVKWYTSNKDIKTCPLCRTTIKIPYIFCQYTNYNYKQLYTHINYRRKSLTINNTNYSFVEKYLYNESSLPAAWLSLSTKDNKTYQPIYIMKLNDADPSYITFYSRMLMLYGNNDRLILTKHNSLNNCSYYDTNDVIFGDMNKYVFMICFEWVYDVMIELKHTWNLKYNSILNTLICDIMFITIKHFGEERNKAFFQAILVCSIYNSIKFYENITIPIEKINYYTKKTYTINEIQKYNYFQSEYIQKNIKTNST